MFKKRTRLGARLEAVTRVLTGLTIALLMFTAAAAAGLNTRQASAAGSEVYVGYADSSRGTAANFPTPWSGSPNTIFHGCPSTAVCVFDAGAVRVVNNSGSPIIVNSVTITVGPCTYTDPVPAALLPGWQLIVTQVSTFAAATCGPDTVFLDTSDVGPFGVPYGGCTNDGIVPTVTVTINGIPTTYSDTGQVLNTGGVDKANCPPGTNESTQWTLIGSAPCVGSNLTLAPPTQSHPVGTTATVTATFTNSCNQPLSNTVVTFRVISGPHTGVTGTGVTDASGRATFTYPGVLPGTDTVQATVTNPAGTITSNTVTVIWILCDQDQDNDNADHHNSDNNNSDNNNSGNDDDNPVCDLQVSQIDGTISLN